MAIERALVSVTRRERVVYLITWCFPQYPGNVNGQLQWDKNGLNVAWFLLPSCGDVTKTPHFKPSEIFNPGIITETSVRISLIWRMMAVSFFVLYLPTRQWSGCSCRFQVWSVFQWPLLRMHPLKVALNNDELICHWTCVTRKRG